jgi:putative FmdB family regulatory protein
MAAVLTSKARRAFSVRALYADALGLVAELDASAEDREPREWSDVPTYDYLCEKCRKSFSALLTMKEHEAKKVTCPKCGSRRVKQKISCFYAVTSRKSWALPAGLGRARGV